MQNQTNGQLIENIRYGYSLGWSFTPLNGKSPVLKGWQKRPRETLEEAIAWAAQGNIGLRTGRASGVVAIDVDPGADIEPLNLSGTVTALTGRPGAFHLYYACDGPTSNSAGKLGQHIDVKADGGQVVFPGSVHPETNEVYSWAEGYEPWNVELAELPGHIVELLKTPDQPPSNGKTKPKVSADTKTKHYAQRALQLELHALCTSDNGMRNETLNKAAFSLGRLIGGGYLDRTEVEAALRSAGESVGLKTTEIDKTICSGLDAGIW